MIGPIIAIVAVVAIAAIIWFLVRRSAAAAAPPAAGAAPRTLPAPPVAEFHVAGDTATVSFDVPLPDGEIDEVLRDLMLHEGMEVVREKRHNLPIEGVTRVTVLGRRAGGWSEVGSVSLETPGELPPPMMPGAIAGLGGDRSFDPFEQLTDLPSSAPGLAGGTGSDSLGPVGPELRLPAALEAGLRSQGIDPAAADAGDLVVGILRATGSTVTAEDADTYLAISAGRRTLIRVVPHREGDHPELNATDIRRFAADFAAAKTDRALLISAKYSPFEIYDRERRDPRARYITRERLQHFVDALALG